MCGITGFVGPGDRQTLQRMTDALAHRGPDDEGTFIDSARNLFLGHRRLSIIDTVGGRQPMCDESGDIQVVFNGEIYNHSELRSELIARGFRFRSHHSDTEVLVHGYRAWGKDLPVRLNGMFAFAIFDRSSESIFLARDGFGEKPLYYCLRDGFFGFASELKALLKHPQVSRDVSRLGMLQLFAYGFIPAPMTIIGAASKLKPGHWMRYNLGTGTCQTRAYREFRITPRTDALPPLPELEEQLRQLIHRAVGSRLMSDVPLGLFLSGGIDSSILLAAMSEHRPPGEIHTFSIGFREPSFDESEHARLVARHFGTHHSEEFLELSHARELLEEVLGRIDEPLGDPSIIPTYLLSKFARRHVTVALGGDGGDELFAGYDPFKAMFPASLYAALVPRSLHRLIRRAAESIKVSDRNMSMEFRIKRTLRGLSYPENLWNPVWIGPVEPDLLGELFGSPVELDQVYAEALDSWEQIGSNSRIDRTLGFYTRQYLSADILAKTDRASMLVSLEARAPFLDNDLVDFCSQLPARYKLHGFTSKYLLRRAYAKKLPRQILARPKKGFGIPLRAWLREWDDCSFIDSLPWIDQGWLRDRWFEHRAGLKDHRQLLWCAIAMDRFLKSI